MKTKTLAEIFEEHLDLHGGNTSKSDLITDLQLWEEENFKEYAKNTQLEGKACCDEPRKIQDLTEKQWQDQVVSLMLEMEAVNIGNFNS